jgi:hypothetical protein
MGPVNQDLKSQVFFYSSRMNLVSANRISSVMMAISVTVIVAKMAFF